jgi:HAD superfamily hydrolase (TIGR01484 family)
MSDRPTAPLRPAQPALLRPLAELSAAAVHGVRYVLLDIDDTLTTEGRLEAVAYAALERLQRGGLYVIPVTGRPAGWCDHIARFWPVDAVVGENGAFWMWHDHQAGKLRTRFVQDEAERADGRRRLEAVRAQVLRDVPGSGIASDQPYRAADLAIDFCEDVAPLPHDEIVHIVKIFEAHGAHAKVSSIHVNGWFGDYDKLTTSRLMMSELFGVDLESARTRYVFSGDSPNDAPMFGYFPHTVGVANILDFGARVATLPAYVTVQRCGAGFAETTGYLLAAHSS